MILYFFLLILCVAALSGGSPASRLAIGYYSTVFIVSGLIFRVFWSDTKMPFETYLLILSSCSLITVAMYLTLPASKWIIAAGLCEVSLMAIYVLLALRVESIINVRLSLMQGLNLAAMAALMGGWLDGMAGQFSRDREGRRGVGTDSLATRSGGLLGSNAGPTLAQGGKGQMP